ncbi:hypothetical protein ACRALDRAFT_207703 [Sodiomyces alcalophilus JCM 7366]|uniref:uncharacterized protein n=1 Tax=Sodiomyces alcalophilus JCM 7366 TaxID=591952 RepID=UPI0039B3F972
MLISPFHFFFDIFRCRSSQHDTMRTRARARVDFAIRKQTVGDRMSSYFHSSAHPDGRGRRPIEPTPTLPSLLFPKSHACMANKNIPFDSNNPHAFMPLPRHS